MPSARRPPESPRRRSSSAQVLVVQQFPHRSVRDRGTDRTRDRQRLGPAILAERSGEHGSQILPYLQSEHRSPNILFGQADTRFAFRASEVQGIEQHGRLVKMKPGIARKIAPKPYGLN